MSNRIKDPNHLMELWKGYKTYSLNRPVISMHYNVKINNTGKVKHIRPLTKQGFIVYLFKQGIENDLQTIITNASGNWDQYANIIHVIQAEIFDHNLSGASVGEYQHNIIARQLGMVDKVENIVKVEPATAEEIQRELDRLLDKAKDSL